MLSWLRRLFLKFELWNNDICIKHHIKREYEYSCDEDRCKECLKEEAAEAQRLQQAHQDRLNAIIAELREWELKK